jgi:hypothetical protein
MDIIWKYRIIYGKSGKLAQKTRIYDTSSTSIDFSSNIYGKPMGFTSAKKHPGG